MNQDHALDFVYTSVVVDDLDAAAQSFVQIGFVADWRGTHPYFDTPAALLATQRGGVLLLQSGAPEDALDTVAASKERWFYVALAGELPEGSDPEVTASYDGPLGPTRLVTLTVQGHPLLVELLPAGVTVADDGSSLRRIESTAFVWHDRAQLAAAFASLGILANRDNDGGFPTLNCLNRVAVLDWHYLEYAEPIGEGVMSGLLQRVGRPGIFGINAEPVDMDAFVRRVAETGLDTNTVEPVELPVENRGKQLICADIITVNPRATGGGRVFVLTPRDYPWGVL